MRNTKQTLPIWKRGPVIPDRIIRAMTGAFRTYECAIALAILASGCSGGDTSGQAGGVATPSERPNPNVYKDPWILEHADKDHPTPAYLSNGFLGLRFGRDGFSKGEIGTAFHLSQVDATGEEKLIPNRNPLGGVIQINGAALDWSKVTAYRQWIDMRMNRLSTRYEVPVDNKSVVITVTNILHLGGSTVEQIIEFGGSPDIRVNYGFLLAKRGESPIFQIDPPEGVGTEDGQINIPKGLQRPIRIIRKEDLHIGSEPGETPQSNPSSGSRLVSCDLEIDGPLEDQIAARSFIYYLTTSIPSLPRGNAARIGPMGLSSATYNGHVFWDADVWIFPALALLDPGRAATIPNYRVTRAHGAERNFKEGRSWHPERPNLTQLAKIDALQYPWESSATGLEVSPTETKQQHHITGTVLFGLDHAAALGLVKSERVIEIGIKAANFYRWRSEVMPNSTMRGIKNTISPDEFHRGDNDRYTNVIAEWTLRRFGSDPKVAFVRPKDPKSGVPLNYESDRGMGYKQAAGVLAIYPLQDPSTEAVADKMMSLYADKVIKNGPAMTDSVHATIWARLGQTERAYETWRKSWSNFTNHPLMLFSEKRSKDETYFLTGAGGSLQTILYGFLGFRLDLGKQPGAAWSTPLKNGYWLSVKPNLPKAWKKVTLKNFEVLGKRYTLIASHNDVRVIPGE